MLDDDYLKQFEECTLDSALFKHQGHLRICWLYLRKFPFDSAILNVTAGIKRYATHLGAAHIYHETLTCAWVHLVYLAMQENNCDSFEEFLNINPHLFDKTLMSRYYSKSLLESDKARREWVTPDLMMMTPN